MFKEIKDFIDNYIKDDKKNSPSFIYNIDIKDFIEICLNDDKKNNVTFIYDFLSNYIKKNFSVTNSYSEHIYNFYVLFPDILSILFKCCNNKIESINDFIKLYSLFFDHILKIILNFPINNNLEYKFNHKKFKIFDYLYERLLFEIVNYEGKNKKYILISKNENINISSFNYERSFSFNIFKCLFDSIINEIESNFLFDKYFFCINSILIKINEAKTNLLFLSCISVFSEKIHKFYLEKNKENIKNELNKELNYIYRELIKGIFFYYRKILNDKTQNIISVSDFGNIYLEYLENKGVYLLQRQLENYIINNFPFFTIIFKDFLIFFNSSDKINDKDWICFTKVIKFITSNKKIIYKYLEEDKRKYFEEIEFFYQLNFPKELFKLSKKEKENIIEIIHSINNKINGSKEEDSIISILKETKKNLLDYFLISEDSIYRLKKFERVNNSKQITMNNIIKSKNKFDSPWFYDIDNENESILLFYFFRFISLIIDLCRRLPIENYKFPKTNLRPLCNVYFIIRNMLLISSMLFLTYVIYLNSPKLFPVIE